MKKATLLLVVAVATVLGGCVVTSVCPYYTAKDLVSEPAMLGTWSNMNRPDELWRFEPSGDFAYQLTLTEPGKATVMRAHAFKLQGQLYLDLFSVEQDYHVIPAHYLLKVSQLTPNLRFAELSEAWLKELLSRDPAAIRHHKVVTDEKTGDSRIVLTAETPELQAFILKYKSTDPAWRISIELRQTPAVIRTADNRGSI